MNSNNKAMHGLQRAAIFALVFHALGLVVALLGIRFGTAVFPTEQRMAFVASSFWGWRAAWGIWFLAALTFVWFLAVVEKAWVATGVCARLSVVVGVSAASSDILFDTIQIVVLPPVAARGGDPGQFLLLAHVASAGGIIVANGLYAIAVALMTWSLRPRLNAIQRWLGWAVLATGMMLTVAGLFSDPHLPEYFAGPAIGTYMLWVVAMAWGEPCGIAGNQ